MSLSEVSLSGNDGDTVPDMLRLISEQGKESTELLRRLVELAKDASRTAGTVGAVFAAQSLGGSESASGGFASSGSPSRSRLSSGGASSGRMAASVTPAITQAAGSVTSNPASVNWPGFVVNPKTTHLRVSRKTELQHPQYAGMNDQDTFGDSGKQAKSPGILTMLAAGQVGYSQDFTALKQQRNMSGGNRMDDATFSRVKTGRVTELMLNTPNIQMSGGTFGQNPSNRMVSMSGGRFATEVEMKGGRTLAGVNENVGAAMSSIGRVAGTSLLAAGATMRFMAPGDGAIGHNEQMVDRGLEQGFQAQGQVTGWSQYFAFGMLSNPLGSGQPGGFFGAQSMPNGSTHFNSSLLQHAYNWTFGLFNRGPG